ncbi:MAG: ribosome recycling factor [Bacteroidetes bacterium]|nr:ribosome recycling factor [Bacteroidota bacterium]MCL5026503.1 ribosome recycling factor [Chloroflexota bacterium]
MVDNVLTEADDKMKKAVEALRHDLTSIRTGRASPALVESLLVDYYGTPTPLNQMASISAPEARLLVIQPWDTKSLAAIEKAILKSDLGLTPANDGRLIRLPIPFLTEERRRELVKVVRRRVEEGRVAVRNTRRDAVDHLREFEKSKDISTDEMKRGQEQLQKLTDYYITEVEKVGSSKEEEILQV